MSIGPLDRIALLGPNGAGKSTLTKMLAGESAPLAGKRIAAADLCASATSLSSSWSSCRPDCDAFWHVRNLGGADFAAGDEQSVRDHLGRFGFEGDRAFEPVARFSGGEKARLTLALLVARRPNLLLLDEPTNHLDIDMRQALTVALQSFEGGMVVVSHDRHLIKTVADALWLVADGKLAGVRRRPGRLPAVAAIARQHGAAGRRRQVRRTGEESAARTPDDTPRSAGKAAPTTRAGRGANRRGGRRTRLDGGRNGRKSARAEARHAAGKFAQRRRVSRVPVDGNRHRHRSAAETERRAAT